MRMIDLSRCPNIALRAVRYFRRFFLSGSASLLRARFASATESEAALPHIHIQYFKLTGSLSFVRQAVDVALAITGGPSFGSTFSSSHSRFLVHCGLDRLFTPVLVTTLVITSLMMDFPVHSVSLLFE